MRSIQSLALAAALVVVAPSAWAVTFDFAALAAMPGGEKGYNNSPTPFSMTDIGSGLTVTATAFSEAEGGLVPSHVYLDGPSGGPGGMGVCNALDPGLQCDPSNDDNLSFNERLTLTFSQNVSVDQIRFRDCDHGLDFDCGDPDDLDNGMDGPGLEIAVGLGPFTPFSLSPSLAPSLIGTSFTFRYVDEKYYISKLKVTPLEPPGEPIPEPATLGLFGAGLLVAGWHARRRHSSSR